MDFLKDQAKKYMDKNSSGQSGQGQHGGYEQQQGGGGGYEQQQACYQQQGGMPHGGHGGSSGVNFSDGIQASDVMGLMGKGGSGINLMDGVQASDLKGLAGAFSKATHDPNMDPNNSNHVINAMGGQQQANNAIGGLLTAFKKQTGQDYNGDEQQTNMLSSLAHQVTGTNIPPSLLGKLAKAQMGM